MMDNQEACARLIAKSSLLNASVAAMQAANQAAIQNYAPIPYVASHFAHVVSISGCTTHDVNELFSGK